MADNEGEEKTSSRLAAELRAKRLKVRKAKGASPFMPSKQSQRKLIPPANKPLAPSTSPEVTTNQRLSEPTEPHRAQLENSGTSGPISDTASPAPPAMPAPSNNEFQQTPEQQNAQSQALEIQRLKGEVDRLNKLVDDEHEKRDQLKDQLDALNKDLTKETKEKTSFEKSYLSAVDAYEKAAKELDELKNKDPHSSPAVRKAQEAATNRAGLAESLLKTSEREVAYYKNHFDRAKAAKVEADGARAEYAAKMEKAQAELEEVRALAATLNDQLQQANAEADAKIQHNGRGLTLAGFQSHKVPKRADANVKREPSEENLTRQSSRNSEEQDAKDAAQRQVSMQDEIDATGEQLSDDNNQTDDEDKTLTMNGLPASTGEGKEGASAKGVDGSIVTTVADVPTVADAPLTAPSPIVDQTTISTQSRTSGPAQADAEVQPAESTQTTQPSDQAEPAAEDGASTTSGKSESIKSPWIPPDWSAGMMSDDEDKAPPIKPPKAPWGSTRPPFSRRSQPQLPADMEEKRSRRGGPSLDRGAPPAQSPRYRQFQNRIPHSSAQQTVRPAQQTIKETQAPEAAHTPDSGINIKGPTASTEGQPLIENTNEPGATSVAQPLMKSTNESAASTTLQWSNETTIGRHISIATRSLQGVASEISKDLPWWFDWRFLIMFLLLAVTLFTLSRARAEECLWRMANDTTRHYFIHRQSGGSASAAPVFFWGEPNLGVSSFLLG